MTNALATQIAKLRQARNMLVAEILAARPGRARAPWIVKRRAEVAVLQRRIDRVVAGTDVVASPARRWSFHRRWLLYAAPLAAGLVVFALGHGGERRAVPAKVRGPKLQRQLARSPLVGRRTRPPALSARPR